MCALTGNGEFTIHNIQLITSANKWHHFQEDQREKELIASLIQLTNRENEQCFGTSGINIVLNFQLKTGQSFVGLIWLVDKEGKYFVPNLEVIENVIICMGSHN